MMILLTMKDMKVNLNKLLMKAQKKYILQQILLIFIINNSKLESKKQVKKLN